MTPIFLKRDYSLNFCLKIEGCLKNKYKIMPPGTFKIKTIVVEPLWVT
jgi:hypothetical protein